MVEQGFMAFHCLFMLVFMALGIAGTVLWIWMLIDCVTKEPDQGNDKLVWILVIALTGALGALIYIIVRRPQRQRLYGR